ncbi:hypothetical protein LE181_26650, partial [Streptomyces sp. SCA3-4]|nr:hypothetical protein [Streptomyces sichuanensis]
RLLRAAAVAAFRPLLLATATPVAYARPAGAPVRPLRPARAVRPRTPLLHSVVRRGPPLRPALG